MFFVDNEMKKLTKTEFLIIKLFLENVGKIFSRDEIINRIWEDAYVSDRTVDVHIRRLRKKMDSASDLIQTYSGFGYGILDS
jgi:DNA-binding response OmpR family regulator